MSLTIKNNEAWILKTKETSSYTIFNRLEAVERELSKNIFQNIKEIELMKLTLTHKGGKLEQSDKFWLKLFLIMKQENKK